MPICPMCHQKYEVSSIIYFGWTHFCEKANKPMYSNGILHSNTMNEVTLVRRSNEPTRAS